MATIGHRPQSGLYPFRAVEQADRLAQFHDTNLDGSSEDSTKTLEAPAMPRWYKLESRAPKPKPNPKGPKPQRKREEDADKNSPQGAWKAPLMPQDSLQELMARM